MKRGLEASLIAFKTIHGDLTSNMEKKKQKMKD